MNFLRFHLVAGLFVALSVLHAGPVPPNKPAAYPAWWFKQNVIPLLPAADDKPSPSWPGDYPVADDYAAANIGQLKHIATQAAAEFAAAVPGGAGTTIEILVNSWNPQIQNSARDDYAALNQGQLKYVAGLFYDRLAVFGFAGAPLQPGQRYPWTESETDDDAYSLVNLGQLKYVFGFSVVGYNFDSYSADSDFDGMPDGWELEHGLNPFDASDAAVVVGNLSNLALYQNSLGPGADPSTTTPTGLIVYSP